MTVSTLTSATLDSCGTVGGNPRKLIDRDRFVAGIDKMVEVLEPQIILVYGSAKYPCFEKLKKQRIKIISYPSKTSMAFAEVKR